VAIKWYQQNLKLVSSAGAEGLVEELDELVGHSDKVCGGLWLWLSHAAKGRRRSAAEGRSGCRAEGRGRRAAESRGSRLAER
jgi:hypothetical protein